ncbi:unnamed protein product [Symbiodinium necroappetens]|uniref:Uncharacterized protein n=1 Tax=Symbiodinium necroappetens TaxID=1628268 RepID=A0A812Z898_9DINO|nr:unnamed protein product [Symbiodinium necroappetens]
MKASLQSVWIWDPVDANAVFHHPQDPPENDEAMAKECFLDGKIGARLNKLSKATLVDQKGSIAMVTREDGSSHEVPSTRMLPWYEGLLVLQELEAKSAGIAWFDDRCRSLLMQERRKRGKVNGALYVEKKLMNLSVTGKRFEDAEGATFSYRRPEVKDTEILAESEDEVMPGRFRIADITGYMPPWEAWCHEHGGFYQDFYQVRWKDENGTAWGAVNFSKVENGAAEAGSTWEPDDCIPPSLDGMRLREKARWLKRKRDQEQKAEKDKELAESAVKSKRPRVEGSSMTLDGGSPVEVEKPEAPPPKMSRYRRNGTPLIQDMFRLKRGHDFEPPQSNKDPDVRSGWPRRAEDYPPGYGCADPPGLCSATCDCMDDQRAQKSWETSKNWLEEPRRAADATMAIDMLSAQTRFVRRRGQVTKCCFFETSQTSHADQTHTNAAMNLCKVLEESVRSVLKDLPMFAIQENGDSVRIPACALMKPGEDYAPVQYQLAQTSTARKWLCLSEEDGKLSLIGKGPPSRPAPFRVEFVHPEGMTAVVDCMVTDTQQKSWLSASATIAARFMDVGHCPLSRNARVVLQEHVGKIFSFEKKVAKEIALGRWLDVVDLLIRMLRTTAMAHVVKSDSAARLK